MKQLRKMILKKDMSHVVLSDDEKNLFLLEIYQEQRKIEGEYIKFDNILETNRYLLLKNHYSTKNAYIYDKQAERTIHTNDEKIEGFINDLDGFLPFWPIDRGRGKASNEMWSVISADEYLEGIEKTGKNPLGIELNENDNPVIVLVQ